MPSLDQRESEHIVHDHVLQLDLCDNQRLAVCVCVGLMFLLWDESIIVFLGEVDLVIVEDVQAF